jgi:hypothetical protein
VIKAIVQLKLVPPYTQSVMSLFDFVNLWGCTLIDASTLSSIATIGIPANKFKVLFGENPRKGKYKIPIGAEYFITEVEVKEIKI